MSIKELTPDQIDDLVGTRHPGAGIEYPPNGLQPYYHWLIRALHLLAESSLGALRVVQDDSLDTAISITPGRASISGAVLDFSGQVSDLAAFNNDTVYVSLFNNAGTPGISINTDAGGWPVGTHIKLAEVTITSGLVSHILDRRMEAVLSV